MPIGGVHESRKLVFGVQISPRVPGASEETYISKKAVNKVLPTSGLILVLRARAQSLIFALF